jgi:hypothetical protein
MRAFVVAADDSSGLPIYAYVIWTAFLGYIVWYGLRLYRKSSERRADKEAGETAPTLRPTASPPSAPVARPPAANPVAPFASTRNSSPPAAPELPVEQKTGADDPSSRSGFFAGTASEGRPPDQARRPVAAILKGISMPDALAPVVNIDAADLSGLRVAFSANGVDPGQVGRAVGDELERLGFTLRSLGDTQLGAQRDHDELVVSILTDPAGIERLGSKAFPLLPANSFVVEFESV